MALDVTRYTGGAVETKVAAPPAQKLRTMQVPFEDTSKMFERLKLGRATFDNWVEFDVPWLVGGNMAVYAVKMNRKDYKIEQMKHGFNLPLWKPMRLWETMQGAMATMRYNLECHTGWRKRIAWFIRRTLGKYFKRCSTAGLMGVMNRTVDPTEWNFAEPFKMMHMRGNDARSRMLNKRWVNWQQNKAQLQGTAMDVKEWAGSHQGEPLFICGNGPSLAKTAPMLKTVKNGKILSINGSVQTLLANGVKPDYWMTADWLCKKEWFDGEWTRDCQGFIYAGAAPMCLQYPWKAVHSFNVADSSMSSKAVWEESKGACYQGSFSSLSIALHMAQHLGFNPIVLVGVDLANTDGNVHPGEKALAEDDLEAKGIDDKPYKTNIGWVQVASSIRAMVYFMDKAGVVVANCTGAGILRDDGVGLRITPLDDTIELLNKDAVK